MIYTLPVRLGQFDSIVWPVAADVDERIPRTTTRANKKTTLVIEFGLGCPKRHFQAAGYAFPHGCLRGGISSYAARALKSTSAGKEDGDGR